MKNLLGSSPETSILGSISGIALAAVEIVPEPYKKYCVFVSAASLVIMGRRSKDTDGIKSTTSNEVAKTVLPQDEGTKPYNIN